MQRPNEHKKKKYTARDLAITFSFAGLVLNAVIATYLFKSWLSDGTSDIVSTTRGISPIVLSVIILILNVIKQQRHRIFGDILVFLGTVAIVITYVTDVVMSNSKSYIANMYYFIPTIGSAAVLATLIALVFSFASGENVSRKKTILQSFAFGLQIGVWLALMTIMIYTYTLSVAAKYHYFNLQVSNYISIGAAGLSFLVAIVHAFQYFGYSIGYEWIMIFNIFLTSAGVAYQILLETDALDYLMLVVTIFCGIIMASCFVIYQERKTSVESRDRLPTRASRDSVLHLPSMKEDGFFMDAPDSSNSLSIPQAVFVSEPDIEVEYVNNKPLKFALFHWFLLIVAFLLPIAWMMLLITGYSNILNTTLGVGAVVSGGVTILLCITGFLLCVPNASQVGTIPRVVITNIYLVVLLPSVASAVLWVLYSERRYSPASIDWGRELSAAPLWVGSCMVLVHIITAVCVRLNR